MSSTQHRSEKATGTPGSRTVDLKLEVVVIPVSDVDRAKQFYGGLGWRLDADLALSKDFRVVQFTPPGSSASIIFGTGVTSAAPGSAQGLHLVAADIGKARADLIERGARVSDVFHDVGGVFHHAGLEGRVAGPDPQHRSYASFASFDDPDGNAWVLQEITARLPGRIESETTYASAAELATALRRAAAAHGQHEARKGKADPEWPEWYAEYMVREQAGEDLPS